MIPSVSCVGSMFGFLTIHKQCEVCFASQSKNVSPGKLAVKMHILENALPAYKLRNVVIRLPFYVVIDMFSILTCDLIEKVQSL